MPRILLLLRPRLLSMRNAWRVPRLRKKSIRQRPGLVLLSLIFMAFVYEGVIRLLTALSTSLPNLSAMLPSLLNPILIMIMSMVFFSTLVSNLAVFYLSDDLPLLKSSPVSPLLMFSNRFFLSLFYSSWMAVIIGIPALIALGEFFHASPFILILCFCAGSILFLLSGSISYIGIALFVRFVPFRWVRTVIKLAGVSLLVLLLFMAQILQGTSEQGDAAQLVQLAELLGTFHTPWNPCFWVAVIISSLLSQQHPLFLQSVLFLFGSTVFVFLAAYGSFRAWYEEASDLLLDPPRFKNKKSTGNSLFTRITSYLPPQLRSIVRKDLRLQLRDPAQMLQLLLLTLIIGVYLSHLHFIKSMEGLDPGLHRWWKAALLIINYTMCSLTLSAVCTRFVYPAISLEGRSFWIVLKSPLGIPTLLRSKVICWTVPIAAMYSLTLLCGVYISSPSMVLGLTSLYAILITPATLVGISVAFGGLYAEFDWEHVSQLSSSGGSLITMLALFFVQVFHLAIYGLLLFCTVRYLNGVDSIVLCVLYSGTTLLVGSLVSVLVVRFFLKRAVLHLTDDLFHAN